MLAVNFAGTAMFLAAKIQTGVIRDNEDLEKDRPLDLEDVGKSIAIAFMTS